MREALIGVVYDDPDGEPASVLEQRGRRSALPGLGPRRAAGSAGWQLRETLVAPQRAYFEYAQREPVAALPTHIGE